MAIYYFNLRDDDTFTADPEGVDLPDVEAARELAVKSAREILAERLTVGDALDGQEFEITDENGTVVATVRFRDTVKFAT